jgi:hypothetical protein
MRGWGAIQKDLRVRPPTQGRGQLPAAQLQRVPATGRGRAAHGAAPGCRAPHAPAKAPPAAPVPRAPHHVADARAPEHGVAGHDASDVGAQPLHGVPKDERAVVWRDALRVALWQEGRCECGGGAAGAAGPAREVARRRQRGGRPGRRKHGGERAALGESAVGVVFGQEPHPARAARAAGTLGAAHGGRASGELAAAGGLDPRRV